MIAFFVLPFPFVVRMASGAGEKVAVPRKISREYGPSAVSRGSFRSVLVPQEDIRVSSPAGGVIRKYHLKEGDRVEKGAVILELDSDFENAVVAGANALLEATQAELEKARKNYERGKTLRSENINSEKQFEEAEYQLALAKGRYNQNLANLSKAEIRLEERFIRSPIDGIFLKKNKSVGEAVARLETVARVVDDSHLVSVVYCDAGLFGAIKPDTTHSLELLDGPWRGKTLSAKVVLVDPLIDPSSGTFRVKLLVEPSRYAASGFFVRFIPPEISVKANE